MAPSGSTGKSLGRNFGEASLHVHPCIPLGFMYEVLVPEIVLAIVAMHELLVKKMEAAAPRSLDASDCLGGNREAKTIRPKCLFIPDLQSLSLRLQCVQKYSGFGCEAIVLSGLVSTPR